MLTILKDILYINWFNLIWFSGPGEEAKCLQMVGQQIGDQKSSLEFSVQVS